MGASPEKHLPETMGGGVAVLDVEGDGDLDLYFVQSGPVDPARRSDAEPALNRLYRNALTDSGSPEFRDATTSSGDAAHPGCGMGVAAGDVDGDGHPDLFVTNFGPDVLLFGDGDGSFRDATDRAGVGDPRWTAGATLFDADADGDLDLFVTAYVAIDVEDPAWCGRREPGYRSYCNPDHYPGLPDRFWRNRGDGRFGDATESAGFSGLAGKGLGAISGDFDGDGDLDLYVANDSVENHLWENLGDGSFADATLVSGTGVNGLGATEAGMGLAAGDVDGDLDLDLFVTNFDHESNTLYENLGGGLFRDATVPGNLEAPSRMPVGFGCLLEDFDHDGALDLVVANGHIIDNVELYDDSQRWRQPLQYFRGRGDGRFDEAPDLLGAARDRVWVGRGLAAGDFDGDGDLDLVLAQCGGPAALLRNGLASDAGLVLEGLPPGTRVRLELDSGTSLLRTAGPAPSYFSASTPALHVGLGGSSVTGLRLESPGEPARVVPVDPPRSAGRWNARTGAWSEPAAPR